MRKSLLIVTAIFFMVPLVNATHVIGGDIHVQWISQTATGADYHIRLRFYRDDVNGGINIPNNITVGIYDAVTHAQITTQNLSRTPTVILNLGDPCYNPDPNVTRTEEGVFDSPTNLSLPNNPNGYYIQTQINARNNLALNVTGNSGNGTMVWFAMIPDPAIGQNSSPDFGNYPLDAYFCTTSPKIIQYPITDADGDSLVYSLVAPLDGNNTSNGNQAGTGGYPFYPPLVFQGGYSLTNYIGGSSPMTMDQATGQIFAAPTNQGFFTFAIRVEEFRDTTAAQNGPKIKIGEVRRDVQYASLICTTGNPPVFIDPSLSSGDIVPIPYNKLYCRDFVMADINTSDTVFMNMTSPIFDSGAVKVVMIPDANDSLTFLTNWNGSFFTDTTKTDTNYFDIALELEFNEGTIGQRFCWTPGCDQVGQTFPFQVNGFSNGCDGLSKDSLPFFITVVPPSAELDYVAAKSIPYGQEYCKNIIFEDTSIVDLLNIEIISDIFNEGAEYPSISSNFVYNSFEHANSVTTGVPNGAQNTQFLATRFCWTPDCEHIGGSFNVRAILSSIDCPTAFKKDTMDFVITVTPPFDSLDVVPNVITPNGDGINDFYRIGGISNPCNDEISVKIYSRWGTLVYESKIPTFEWSGTNKSGGDVPNGTYFVLVSGIYGSEVVTLDQRTVTVLR